MSAYVQTEDGSQTISNEQYGETYHSVHGAFTEAQHVFLMGSGVAQRLKSGHATRVLEIGFGLGLNTLLTADLAKTNNAPLAYHSYEHQLIDADVISRLKYGSLLNNPDLAESLAHVLACRKPQQNSSPTSNQVTSSSGSVISKAHPALSGPENTGEFAHEKYGVDTLQSFSLAKGIALSIHCKDASTSCLFEDTGGQFDAIYLDAFSPACNPECWSAEFFQQLKHVMSDTGCLSTYSAKGDVRRAMLAAGLRVRKAPGPPGKREMLIADAV